MGAFGVIFSQGFWLNPMSPIFTSPPNLQPRPPHPHPSTFNPGHQNPNPQTFNPNPQILNPRPYTLKTSPGTNSSRVGSFHKLCIALATTTHPRDNSGANRWFLLSFPVQMLPPEGSNCGRLTQDLPMVCLQGDMWSWAEVGRLGAQVTITFSGVRQNRPARVLLEENPSDAVRP